MQVVTKKFIREFIRDNAAVCVDLDEVYRHNKDDHAWHFNELRDTLFISHGTYGTTGFIQRGRDSGTFYVCLTRGAAMFYYL